MFLLCVELFLRVSEAQVLCFDFALGLTFEAVNVLLMIIFHIHTGAACVSFTKEG